MESKTPWMGEYIWEENKCDGSAPQSVPLPDEVLAMFRPSKCLLCGIVTNNQQSAFTHYESKGHFKKVAQHMREKYNVLGNLKSKEKFQPVKCDICQTEITSRVVLMQHYEGKQHLKNLKKKSSSGASGGTENTITPTAEAPTTKVEGDFENPLDYIKDLPPPPPLPKLGTYFCSLCQIKTKSKGQMEQHNVGPRHMKNLSKLADGELKEFFLRNGNCEPVETDAQDPTPPPTPARDSQMVSPFPQAAAGAPVGGYPYPPGMDPSMGMPMMPPMPPPFPQMPYGQYPQYPMSYDYNAWNQGQQGYNAGQPSYDYNAAQQPYGQPMYNTGQYSYPNNQQQQYSSNQPAFSTNMQAYSNTKPPFLSGPPPYVTAPETVDDPCPAAPGTTDPPVPTIDGPTTLSSSSSNPQTTTSSSSSAPSQTLPGPLAKRKWGRSSPKDPEVRESEVPEDFEMKPLVVSNFIKLLAHEAKLEKELNNPSTNPPSDAETADSGKARNMEAGDSASQIEEVDVTPENKVSSTAVNMDDSVGGKVGDDSLAGKADDDRCHQNVEVGRGVVAITESNEVKALHTPVLVGKNDSQDGVIENLRMDDASKSSTDDRVDEENEGSSNPIERSKEDSDRTPSSQDRERESNPDGQFSDTGFTEGNVDVQESIDSSEGNANKTVTDAFKFKIGGKSTIGKPTVNTCFRRSTGKMLKEAKEKKRLQEVKKLKDSAVVSKKDVIDGKAPLGMNVGAISNICVKTHEPINTQSLKDVEATTKPVEENISMVLDERKLDKSDGEISDDPGDRAAVVSSENAKGFLSVNKASYLTKNTVSDGDHVGNRDKIEEEKSDKVEQNQNAAPSKPTSSPEKQKSSTKKFSASDKKKVSRTRGSSSDSSRKSRSRSRSHRKRSGRRRSSSWSPSSEDDRKNEYQEKNDNHGQQDNYQNYYGYNNRNRNWRNNRGYYHNNRGFHHQRNYWNQQRYGGWDYQDGYYEKQYEETDEFGREKKRRDDKKKEKRESRKRKKERRSPSVASMSSKSSSGSRSRSKKKLSKDEKRAKQCKKKRDSSNITMKNTSQTPDTPKERIISDMSHIDKQTPLTLAQKLRLEKSDRASKEVPGEREGRTSNETELPLADPVRRVAKQTSPKVTAEIAPTEVVVQKSLLQKPTLPSKLLEVLEKEREKQEILKKMAFIKMKLQQNEKEKSAKKKKKKKEKSKKKKKKRSSSTSSSSSSSSSSSDSSSSSSSSASSSQGLSLAEKLLANMRRGAKGPGPSSVLPDLAKVLPHLKKKDPEESSKKKKRKKDKKSKKKKNKKSRKAEPSESSLAAYITPSGMYYCKYCNLTLASGNSFIEHFLSEKHKLLYKIVKEKGTS